MKDEEKLRRERISNTCRLNTAFGKVKKYKNNTSGVTGVCFIKNSGKWLAWITEAGQRKWVGTFRYKEDAVAARKEAEQERRRRTLGQTDNLIGATSGLLTCTEDNGNKEIKCRCQCGNECTVDRYNFINGHTRSCGCLQKKGIGQIKSIVGQKIGMLTVLEELGGNKIRCRCDCGKECIRTKSMVKAGKCISCGCTRKPRSDKYTRDYMLSHKFGMLKPIKEMPNGFYMCVCDCGNTIAVPKWQLTTGIKRNCGCKTTNSTNTVGRRNGHLTVIKEMGGSMVKCKCDCGNVVVLRKQNALAPGRKYCSRTCPLRKKEKIRW